MSYERFPTWAGSGTYFTSVASSTSNNTKGSFATVAAATSADCGLWWVQFGSQTATHVMLTDIATGAAASEVVQVANLMTQTGNDASGASAIQVMATVGIPAGTRLSARSQSSSGTGPPASAVTIFLDEGVGSGGRPAPTTYGVSTGTSLGTQVDPGGTINTKGSYAQVTASTTSASTLLGVISGLIANALPTFCEWSMDVSTGAGGAEVVLIPDLAWQSSDLGGDQILPGSYNLPNVPIATSTRIACRAACTINDATDRLFNVALVAGISATDTPIVSVVNTAVFANPMAVGY